MTLRIASLNLPLARPFRWGLALAAMGALIPSSAVHAQEIPVALQAPESASQLPSAYSSSAAESATVVEDSSTVGGVLVAEANLPDAPLPHLPQGVVPPKPAGTAGPGGQPVAPVNSMMIPAGWRAQPLTARQKVAAGARDIYSLDNLAALVLSASYEQVLNSEPNYGTGAGAYGQRLGAAAVRETSQTVFTEMVFAPLLHEDDRYYQKGPAYNPVKRTLYAITRPLITRTDAGGETVNGSLLLGYAAAAALTPAYYPQSNRNFHDTLSTYGGSIGGSALGFFVSEFSSDVLQALHLSHPAK